MSPVQDGEVVGWIAYRIHEGRAGLDPQDADVLLLDVALSALEGARRLVAPIVDGEIDARVHTLPTGRVVYRMAFRLKPVARTTLNLDREDAPKLDDEALSSRSVGAYPPRPDTHHSRSLATEAAIRSRRRS